MDRDSLKRAAAEAALKALQPRLEADTIIGIGTGSTTNHFIDALAAHAELFDGAVASSGTSAERLRSHHIPVYDLTAVSRVDVYVDGADECNPRLQLVKGGGAALTREKIIASAARRFICIADDSKWVDVLGSFPLPVEVIPMARSLVARELVALGGDPVLREGVVTDNGNCIIDVHHLRITEPLALESRINDIPGVVCNGLFARRPADLLLLAGSGGVRQVTRPDTAPAG